MTAEELIAYYQNLLLIQYRGQPNARATIGALVREAIGDTLTIFPDVRDVWDLETATGKQLDIIGNIFGMKRYIYGVGTTKQYFGMPQLSIGVPDDPNSFYGFIAVADIPPGGFPETPWYWFTQPDLYTLVGELDDGTYRRLLKYLILLRSMDVTMENIDWLFNPAQTKLASDGSMKTADDWFAPSIHLWGDAVLPVYATDNGDMTVTYTVSPIQSGPGIDNVILIAAIKALNAFPKPAGAELIIVG